MNKKQCYNCGKPLNDNEKTREHIPPQSLFVGYGSEYKINRITVPACNSCNKEYAEIDNELRDAIGITNENDNAAKELSAKTARSILRKPNWLERVQFNASGKVESVKFDYSSFKKAAIKDFKGLFYHKYGYPLSNEWKIEIIASFEKDEKLSSVSNALYGYLQHGTDWLVSGHGDIFSFIMKTLVPDVNKNLFDADSIESAVAIASAQIYHDKIGFVVIAARESLLDEIREQNERK